MVLVNDILFDGGEKGQVNHSAAQIYDEFFVPALFQQWPPIIAEKLGIKPNDLVLDVACGTGVLAHHMTKIVDNEKQIFGVDINDGMLAVAKQNTPNIHWYKSPAEALPFDDNSFDAVASQFGIMFFENPVLAVKEMLRVLKPNGKLCLAVWDSLERTPGYSAVAELLLNLFGKRIADEIHAPYILGNKAKFQSLISSAGIDNVTIDTLPGKARFSSIDTWIHTDIKGWTLTGKLDNAQFDELLHKARERLKSFVDVDGRVRFAAPAHIATVMNS